DAPHFLRIVVISDHPAVLAVKTAADLFGQFDKRFFHAPVHQNTPGNGVPAPLPPAEAALRRRVSCCRYCWSWRVWVTRLIRYCPPSVLPGPATPITW